MNKIPTENQYGHCCMQIDHPLGTKVHLVVFEAVCVLPTARTGLANIGETTR